MLTHPTHGRLVTLGLTGMAKALDEQQRQPDIATLAFEERLALLVDREATERENKRLVSRLRVSDSPIPLFRWLDFFVGLSANASRPRDYAARRSAERCAAQPQGMSSSRRDAGQRLTSFVSTSAK